MSDEHVPLPPYKPFTFSRWALSSLLTLAVLLGAFGATAVLFLGDRFFNVGEDPAITRVQSVSADVSRVDQRLANLERKVQKVETAPKNIVADVQLLQQDVSKNNQQAAALEQKVDALQIEKKDDSYASRILLGVTQLKTAYDNDLSLDAGIQTLQNTVTDENAKKVLSDLSATVQAGLPSKESLLTAVRDLQKQPEKPATPATATDPTWKDRAKETMSQFVTVRPAEEVKQQSIMTRIEQAITINDLPTAKSLVAQLPQTPTVNDLALKIQTRIDAQNKVHQLISTITSIANPQAGSLY